MKKVVKKTLIYGGSLLVLGGAVTGITIPVLNAKNKIHKSSIPTGLKNDSPFTKHSQVGDYAKNNDDKGQKETTLLNKAKYQLSFKLYEEEQAASFDFQKADFKYEMYQKAKDAIQAVFDNNKIAVDFNKQKKGNVTITYDQDFINNPLKINEVEKDFDNFIKWAEKQAQAVIDNSNPNGATDKIKKENKDKAEKLKNKLKDLKEEHLKIKDKLVKVSAKNHPDIDFSLSSISSDYPRLMLPLKTIRDKQSKIFNDAKDAFIKNFETKEKGIAEWPKNLIKTYNGAETKDEALDYLVSNETQNVAFKRFKYKINADFTVEKIITGIYNDILGIKTTNFASLKTPKNENKLDLDSIVDSTKSTIKTDSPTKETILFANKDFTTSTDLIKSLQEKVYFLGTESLVTKGIATNQNFFSPNFNDKNTQDYIDGLIGTKIAKIENAIIGLTPNSEDPQAAWQYGSQIKDKRVAIINALKLFATGDINKTKYITGYNDADKIFGKENDISKTLIAEVTATQDSSKYKGGDYGWKSQLDNVKGMTAGFGVGLIAAFKDISEQNKKINPTNPIKTTISGSGFVEKMASVKLLFKAIFDGLNNFIAAKGGTKLVYKSNPTIREIEKYNKTLKQFTKKEILSDDDILKYIGASVRKTVNTSNKTTSHEEGLFRDQDGKSTSLLPPVIDLGESTSPKKGRVYIFTTEEFGMHLVRIVKGKSILSQINLDLAKVANKQDVKEANTDYVSLLNNALTTNKQIEELLGLKINSGNPELTSNDYAKVIEDNYKKFNDSNNDYKNAKDLKDDIARLLNSLKTADIIAKVNSSVPSTYKDWLIKLMDNKIMLEPDKSGLTPEDIYNWAIQEEEK